MSNSFQTVGLYVTPEIVSVLDEVLYESCGVVDVREYYDEQGTVQVGDPLAEVFDAVLRDILDDFAEIYRETDFAIDVSYDGFELLTVGASSDAVYLLRDKVEAVRVLEECDTRTVHTAMLGTAIDMGYFDGVAERDDVSAVY